MSNFKFLSLCFITSAFTLTGCGGAATSEDLSGERQLSQVQETVEQEEAVELEVTEEEIAQEESMMEEVVESINDAIDDVIANVQVRLSWSPASFYEDGSIMPETEISHYELVYGNSPESMDTSVNIDLAGLSSYDIENLPEGEWHIALRTVSIYGGISDLSNMVSVSL